MKNILLSLLTCFAITTTQAQNIIPNSSFALYSGCPNDFSCIDSSSGWHSATLGTPDYFNPCATFSYVDLPMNIFGYQTSSSNSYSGIFSSTPTIDYREYITRSFPSLEIGATYKVSIVISLADSSYYAADGLGVFFFKSHNLPYGTFNDILLTPQVDYSSYGMIQDKTNWITLTKNFIADSNYTNLIIGNFKTVVDTIIAPFPCSATNVLYQSAYYYFDSVSVEKLSGGLLTRDIDNSNAISIFPNPFTSSATLKFNNETKSIHTLDIYSTQGTLVRRVNDIITDVVSLDKAELSTGMYYYRLYNAINAISSGTFVISDNH